MCLSPKLIRIKINGTYLKEYSIYFNSHPEHSRKFFRVYVPCGHCYECQNNLRTEFCYRAKSEWNDSKSAFFVTLTYSDSNLPYWDFSARPSEVSKELSRIKLLPVDSFFKYDKFILNKKHASLFLKKMQSSLKSLTVRTALFRAVIVGEYGLLFHRPHYHALIFSPYLFSLSDFEKLVKKCWLYGNCKVGSVTASSINYIAKHFVKSDTGCKLQQEVSPNFMIRSVYAGGIGRSLYKDKVLMSNYFNDVKYSYSSGYRVALPRILRKHFHKDSLNFEELLKLENDSFDNFRNKYFNLTSHIIEPSFVEEFEMYDYGKKMSNLRKFNYNRSHFIKKVIKFRSESINYNF